jgi:adenosylmethionine-8-amino-7-oxononanoate aminotransferase
LVGGTPGGLTHAYFVSSGSEAMEAAIKLARQYHIEHGEHGRHRIVSRRQGYHGTTLGALSASGHLARRTIYEPILSDAFSRVSPAFAYRYQRAGETETEYVARLADELDAAFRALDPATVAAFVAEPVVGAATGAVPAPTGYFRAIRAVCDRHGVLLILDEVMCGMGRTGTLHAWEQEGISPDIQLIAKGLGGGYQPIGALLIGGRVADVIAGSAGFIDGHTYQSHPVACAAALAVQDVIAEENLLPRVRAMGDRMRDALHDRLGNHAHVGDIRGRGLLMAIELVADRGTRAPFDPALGLNLRVKEEALALGVAVYPGAGTADGKRGDHVLLAPPYIVTEAEIDTIVARLGGAVDAALARTVS